MYILNLKCEQMSTISRVKNKDQVFCDEDYRLKQTLCCRSQIVYHMEQDQLGIAPFRKLEDCDSSDKVLSWRSAIKPVTWPLFRKFLTCAHVHWVKQSVCPSVIVLCRRQHKSNLIWNTWVSLTATKPGLAWLGIERHWPLDFDHIQSTTFSCTCMR